MVQNKSVQSRLSVVRRSRDREGCEYNNDQKGLAEALGASAAPATILARPSLSMCVQHLTGHELVHPPPSAIRYCALQTGRPAVAGNPCISLSQDLHLIPKLIRKTVGNSLTNLDYNPLPDDVAERVPLFGGKRVHGRGGIRKPL